MCSIQRPEPRTNYIESFELAKVGCYTSWPQLLFNTTADDALSALAANFE